MITDLGDPTEPTLPKSGGLTLHEAEPGREVPAESTMTTFWGQPRLRQEHPINDEAVSPLRRRTIEDMTITVRGHEILFKIDYYDRALVAPSPRSRTASACSCVAQKTRLFCL